jgi:hypothetical protein
MFWISTAAHKIENILHSDSLDPNPLDSTVPNAKPLGSNWPRQAGFCTTPAPGCRSSRPVQSGCGLTLRMHCNFSVYEEAGVLSGPTNKQVSG